MFTQHALHLGAMFERAARRHGAVRVDLDRPLDVAPEAGLRHSYVTLADLVDRLAGALVAAGVGRGDQVAIYKSNNVDIAVLACALSRIGAVPALLSPSLDGQVVEALLRRMQRPWLLTDAAALTGALAEIDVLATASRILVVGPGAADAAAAAGGITVPALGDTPRVPTTPAGPREAALITHSSGTTGLPKLAVHCPNTLWHRLMPQLLMGWPSRGETAAFCMSYVHSRFYHALGVMLHYGSPLLLLVAHEPAEVAPLLAMARPGILETHPNTFVLWEELADAPEAPLANVAFFGSTFDAIHPRTIQRLLAASHRRFPVLVQLYGQSETGPVVARWFNRRGAARANGRLVGAALPGFTRIRVVDDQGKPCRPGEQGHIEARTRGRILTYLGAAEQYAQQLRTGWWRMGDVGHRTRWGGLYLADREIDQIDAVASNLELEDILMSRLAELREVVIVPGAAGEPVPVVCTRSDLPLDQDRWRAAVAGLPPLAAPVVCRFDDLPRTGTWKIKRVEIAKLLAESQSLSRNWVAG